MPKHKFALWKQVQEGGNTSSAWAYGFAVLLVALATIARLLLTPLVGPEGVPYITYFLANAVAMRFVGKGPAIVAILLGTLTADWFFLPPLRAFGTTPGQYFGAVIFIGANLLVLSLAQAMRRAKEMAEANARGLRQSESALRTQKDLLGVTLASIGDAVIVTDVQGRVTFLNAEAERLTGWTNAQGKDQPLPEVFKIINEQTGEPVENPVDKVRRLNQVVGLANHSLIVSKDGRQTPIDDSAAPIRRADGPIEGVVLVFRDITERKQGEEAIRKSEERVRLKLHSILSPEGDLGQLELTDIIDVPAIQALMEDWYKLTGIPMAIIDLKGGVVVGVGWQEICTAYHRVHPETGKHCIESDTELTAGVAPGECKLYKCKNNMWDIASPLLIGGKKVGNLFSGQFFFEDELIDYASFRVQCRQYGFPEREYLAALKKAPRLSREKLKQGMAFLVKLAQVISQLSYSTLQLARSLAQRDGLMASLQASEEQVRVAAIAAEIGTWHWTPGTNSVTVTANWRQLFGISDSAVVTFDTWRNSLHPEDRDHAVREINAAAQEHRDFNVEYRVVRPDGSMRWVIDRGRATYDESGRAISMAGVNVDITKRKQAEQALRDSKEELARTNDDLECKVQQRTAKLHEVIGDLEHFSYTITHDMRAPLRAMQGFGGILLDQCATCPQPEGKDFLRRITESANRMDNLITDALNYSKVVREELELEPVDPSRLLHGIIESYPQFQSPKAEIRIDGPLPLVLGNSAGLTQCFSNLLGNAIKFIEPGKVPRIRIWAEMRPNSCLSWADQEKTGGKSDVVDQQLVRLWFEDNGIGIAPHHQEQIFIMFQRLSKNYEGTGIGLALVRKVIERMKGRVGVESEEGQGSRFWVELKKPVASRN